MSITLKEIKSYDNFDELALDVIELAKEILPGKLIYINSLSEGKQVTLKVSNTNVHINLKEGLTIDVEDSICNRVDFKKNEPLIYEDIKKESSLDNLQKLLISVNINAYMGIPISLDDGSQFGTLCAAYHESTTFDQRSIDLMRRIAKMFSYYLEVEHIAYKDSLTNLYNRQYLYKFIANELKGSGAFMFLDLDGFKQVNDKLGHDIGDDVLITVGTRLEQVTSCYKKAYVVRLGGDEFLVSVHESLDDQELLALSNSIIYTLSNWTLDKGVALSASLGIITYSEDDKVKLKTILKLADDALYEAKSLGKRQAVIKQY